MFGVRRSALGVLFFLALALAAPAQAPSRSLTLSPSGTALIWPTSANLRTAAGLVIGTDVQAYDADLTIYAGITPSANVQTLLGRADYAAFRTSLSLVIGTNVQAWDADLDDLADGSLTGSKVGTGIVATNITTGQLGVPNGGTGAATLTGFLSGHGTGAVTASTTVSQSFSADNFAAVTSCASGVMTKLILGTERRDSAGTFASSRWTPTIAGICVFAGGVNFAGAIYNPYVFVLYKNGVELDRFVHNTNTVLSQYIGTSLQADCNGTGDYFEIYFYQDTGSALNISALWSGIVIP
ncbi:MAG: hypothetical protein QOE70_4394 [Chthoniobacter sp.]|nr:hypothetical protein [Chthoniobacter sp.]